ncbi:MAG: copper-binding protein [Bdellovibrionales bacterium]|jgi:Cu(I)/Ag(I) efflux system protein CusF|nr:copper-binding protein [Bdellovibrionales bacterium]
MKRSLICGWLIAISTLFFGLNAGAESSLGGHDAEPYAAAYLFSAPAGYPVVNGEVRKVDLSALKITIRHEEIPNLDMPPMTMVFKAANREMLEAVAAGAKIHFVADSFNGQMTVLWLEVL